MGACLDEDICYFCSKDNEDFGRVWEEWCLSLGTIQFDVEHLVARNGNEFIRGISISGISGASST